MAELHFTENGWTDYLYWQATDKKTLKRINDLLKECLRTPFEGKGKPEPLTGNYAGKWSRRINEKDRLVYASSNGQLVIYECRTHYKEK